MNMRKQRQLELGIMAGLLAGGMLLFVLAGVWVHCSAIPAACGG